MRAERRSRGIAAIVLAPDGAGTLGHVGWGIEEGPDDWVYGSLNPSRIREMLLPGQNGAWEERGGYKAMIRHFLVGGEGERYSFQRGYYTQAKFVRTPQRRVAAPERIDLRRWWSPRDCLSDARTTLLNYGATKEQLPDYRNPLWLAPNHYYRELSPERGWTEDHSLSELARDGGPPLARV
jgi:hypothetical protein